MEQPQRSDEIIELKDGPLVAASALWLALELEDRGWTMSVSTKGDGKLVLSQSATETQQSATPLTENDKIRIRQWRNHLLAVVGYIDYRNSLTAQVLTERNSAEISDDAQQVRNKAQQSVGLSTSTTENKALKRPQRRSRRGMYSDREAFLSLYKRECLRQIEHSYLITDMDTPIYRKGREPQEDAVNLADLEPDPDRIEWDVYCLKDCQALLGQQLVDNLHTLYRFWMSQWVDQPWKRKWALRVKVACGLALHCEERQKRRPRADAASEHLCWVCLKSQAEHWHHIIMIADGGIDDVVNMVPLCLKCHREVHAKITEDFL